MALWRCVKLTWLRSVSRVVKLERNLPRGPEILKIFYRMKVTFWKALLNLLTLSCTNRNLLNLTNWTKETRLSTCRARGTLSSALWAFWGDRLSLVSTFPLTRGISRPVPWELLKTVLMCKTQIVTHTSNHQQALGDLLSFSEFLMICLLSLILQYQLYFVVSELSFGSFPLKTQHKMSSPSKRVE